jgi:hypothetical protein
VNTPFHFQALYDHSEKMSKKLYTIGRGCMKIPINGISVIGLCVPAEALVASGGAEGGFTRQNSGG